MPVSFIRSPSLLTSVIFLSSAVLLLWYCWLNYSALTRNLLLLNPRESSQQSFVSAHETKDLYLSIKTYGKCFLTPKSSHFPTENRMGFQKSQITAP